MLININKKFEEKDKEIENPKDEIIKHRSSMKDLRKSVIVNKEGNTISTEAKLRFLFKCDKCSCVTNSSDELELYKKSKHTKEMIVTNEGGKVNEKLTKEEFKSLFQCNECDYENLVGDRLKMHKSIKHR